MRILSLLATILLFTPISAKTPLWKETVSQYIEDGNLKTANDLILELPETIKENDGKSIDSLLIIMDRIRYDFSLTPEDGLELIKERYPNVTDNDIDQWKLNKYIEYLDIDGKEFWFRKAVRNLWLLNPIFQQVDEQKLNNYNNLVTTIIKSKTDSNRCSNWHNATIKFTLDVNADIVPDGEVVNVWIPIPLNTSRQKDFKLLSSSSFCIKSIKSAHNTLLLSSRAKSGKVTHFDIQFSFKVASQYFDKEYLLKNLKPYNCDTEFYKLYTSSDNKHIIIDKSITELAYSIVGKEDNPVKKAELIYNWITSNFPWAGARDYGTIKNIPVYVLNQKHGDCGQVALLYITMTRALGIPSRWESGWMLHPWDINYHDWAETYFEGIGWVPTDVSIGRNSDLCKSFYFSGTDMYRMASNSNYKEPLSPTKLYIRTDPLDFQAGEVEWRKGNIESNDYNSSLKIISFEPITK